MEKNLYVRPDALMSEFEVKTINLVKEEPKNEIVISKDYPQVTQYYG